MIDNDLKAKLKDSIREKIDTVKEDIVSYTMLAKPVSPDNAIGRLTRMEAINSKSINEAALSTSKETLSKLERALAKIESPEFGACRQCEEPIPFARLKILPEADLCVRCAENLDR